MSDSYERKWYIFEARVHQLAKPKKRWHINDPPSQVLFQLKWTEKSGWREYRYVKDVESKDLAGLPDLNALTGLVVELKRFVKDTPVRRLNPLQTKYDGNVFVNGGGGRTYCCSALHSGDFGRGGSG